MLNKFKKLNLELMKLCVEFDRLGIPVKIEMSNKTYNQENN